MDSWLATAVGAWLLLSVFVSLGLARAMSLSSPSDRRRHALAAGGADGQRLGAGMARPDDKSADELVGAR